MGSNVQIYLDSYGVAFYPGQTVSGRVECFFDTQERLRAVRIKFRGRAETNWTESESYYDDMEKKTKYRDVHYSGKEVYFDAEYDLIAGGDNFSLPAGRHNFPFSYILPAQLPSSFDGVYGNVRYTVTAVVDRPWKFDFETKVFLNIISPLDLNYVPRACEPVATSDEKNLCCCWCKSGPLTFDMSLPATGYVPGQEVNIGAYVQNMSNVSAECVKFKLRQELVYIAHIPSTKRNYSSNTIWSLREGGIGAHGEKSWTSTFVLPKDGQYPNLMSCGIINVSYTLRGQVVLPCPHSNLSTDCSFTVGTIPLSGVDLSVPGPPPEVPASSSFNVNPPIGLYMPGGPNLSEKTPLMNNPGGEQNNVLPPYPFEKVPYSPPGSIGEPSFPNAACAPMPTAPPTTLPTAPPTAPTNTSPAGPVPYPTGTAPYPVGTTSDSSGTAPYPLGFNLAASDLAPPSYEEVNPSKEKH